MQPYSSSSLPDSSGTEKYSLYGSLRQKTRKINVALLFSLFCCFSEALVTRSGLNGASNFTSEITRNVSLAPASSPQSPSLSFFGLLSPFPTQWHKVEFNSRNGSVSSIPSEQLFPSPTKGNSSTPSPNHTYSNEEVVKQQSVELKRKSNSSTIVAMYSASTVITPHENTTLPSFFPLLHYPRTYRPHRRIPQLASHPQTTLNLTTKSKPILITIHSSSAITNSTPKPSEMVKMTTTTPRCEKLTDEQKYSRLESVGGRNQQFMANSPEEAGRNFPRLIDLSEQEQGARNGVLFEAPNFEDDDEEIFLKNREVEIGYCDEQCKEIKVKLAVAMDPHHSEDDGAKEAIDPHFVEIFDEGREDDKEEIAKDKEEVLPQQRQFNEDAWEREAASVEQPGSQKQKKQGKVGGRRNKKVGCYLERFIPVGNCTHNGEEEKEGHEKLCTACQGVYVLNDDCFPVFLNSVVCDKFDTQCIFDRFSGSAQGKCQTKTLSFKVMRNKGDDECEEWVFEYLDVPVACECYLSKTSWLDSMQLPLET